MELCLKTEIMELIHIKNSTIKITSLELFIKKIQDENKIHQKLFLLILKKIELEINGIKLENNNNIYKINKNIIKIKKEINFTKDKINKNYQIFEKKLENIKNINIHLIFKEINYFEQKINYTIRLLFLNKANIINNSIWQSPCFEKNILSRSPFQLKDDIGKYYQRSIITPSYKELEFLKKTIKNNKSIDTKIIFFSSGMAGINAIISLIKENKNWEKIALPKHTYSEINLFMNNFEIIKFENENIKELFYKLKKKKPNSIFMEIISNTNPSKKIKLKLFLKKLHDFPFLKNIIIDTSSNFASFKLEKLINKINDKQIIFEVKSIQKNNQLGLDLVTAGLVKIICKKKIITTIRQELFKKRQMGLNLTSHSYLLIPFQDETINSIRDSIIFRNNLILPTLVSKLKFNNLNIDIDSPCSKIKDYKEGVPFFNINFRHKYANTLNIIFFLIKNEKNSTFTTGTSFGFNFTRIDFLTNKGLRISMGIDNVLGVYCFLKEITKIFEALNNILKKRGELSKFDKIRKQIYLLYYIIQFKPSNYEKFGEIFKKGINLSFQEIIKNVKNEIILLKLSKLNANELIIITLTKIIKIKNQIKDKQIKKLSNKLIYHSIIKIIPILIQDDMKINNLLKKIQK